MCDNVCQLHPEANQLVQARCNEFVNLGSFPLRRNHNDKELESPCSNPGKPEVVHDRTYFGHPWQRLGDSEQCCPTQDQERCHQGRRVHDPLVLHELIGHALRLAECHRGRIEREAEESEGPCRNRLAQHASEAIGSNLSGLGAMFHVQAAVHAAARIAFSPATGGAVVHHGQQPSSNDLLAIASNSLRIVSAALASDSVTVRKRR